MSETISFEAVWAEDTVVRPPEPEYDVADYIDPEIDDSELFNLVSQNAHVIIKFGGSEMTLSEVMSLIPITKDNIPSVISMVRELLANAAVETEDPEEEAEEKEAEVQEKPAEGQETEQKSSPKPEVQEKPANSMKVDGKNPSKKETNQIKQPDPPASRIEKTPEPVATTITDIPEVLPVTVSTPEKLTPESATHQTSQELKVPAFSADNQLGETKPAIKSEVEARQPVQTFDIPETEATANSIIEAKPTLRGFRLDSNQNSEPPAWPVVIEAVAEAEPATLSPPDLAIAEIPDDTATELGDEAIDGARTELTSEPLEYQIGSDSFINFVEEESLLGHSEEVGLEPNEPYEIYVPTVEVVEDKTDAAEEALISELGNESNLSEPTETTTLEPQVQTSLTIEEIEGSLIQLAGHIEAGEPETIKKTNDILEKIIEVPTNFEAGTIITEAHAQEELEELFTELLEVAGIECTLELIEYLARLTLERRLADEMQKLKSNDETDSAPQGVGTHEIIKKLLLSLSTLKKTLAQAGAIGKSTLKLYILNEG